MWPLMINKSVYMSSNSNEWETPQDFFNALDEIYHFRLDAAASAENHKCPVYFDEEKDALALPWTGYGPVWVNPPYGRQIDKWVAKAAEESKSGATIVMLIPARTETRYWHDYIFGNPNAQVTFIRGRLKFSNAKASAPFPSAVVVFRPSLSSTISVDGCEISPGRIDPLLRQEHLYFEDGGTKC